VPLRQGQIDCCKVINAPDVSETTTTTPPKGPGNPSFTLVVADKIDVTPIAASAKEEKVVWHAVFAKMPHFAASAPTARPLAGDSNRRPANDLSTAMTVREARKTSATPSARPRAISKRAAA
jgi:hypothetical protein